MFQFWEKISYKNNNRFKRKFKDSHLAREQNIIHACQQQNTRYMFITLAK